MLFEWCKKSIVDANYQYISRDMLRVQIEYFHDNGKLTDDQYNELTSLMDQQETVKGDDING